MSYLLCGCDATFKGGHIQMFEELNFYLNDSVNITIPVDVSKPNKVMGSVGKALRLIETNNKDIEGVIILTWGGPELKLFREVSKGVLLNKDYDVFIIDLQSIAATDHLPRGLSAAYSQQFLISEKRSKFTKDMIDARNIKQIGRLVADQFDTTIFSPHLNISTNKIKGRVDEVMYKELTTMKFRKDSISKLAQRAGTDYPNTVPCFIEWASKNNLPVQSGLTAAKLWQSELSPIIIGEIEEYLHLAGLSVAPSNYPITMTATKFLSSLTKSDPYEVLVLSSFIATNVEKYQDSLAMQFCAFKLMSNLKFLEYNEFSLDNPPKVMKNFKMPRRRVTYKDVGHQEINNLRRYLAASLQTNLNILAEKSANLVGISLGLTPSAFKEFIRDNPTYLMDGGKVAPIVDLTDAHLQALVNLIRCKVPMPNNPTLSVNTDIFIRIIETSNHESISLLMEYFTQIFIISTEQDPSLLNSPLYVLYLTVLEVCDALNIELEDLA